MRRVARWVLLLGFASTLLIVTQVLLDLSVFIGSENVLKAHFLDPQDLDNPARPPWPSPHGTTEPESSLGNVSQANDVPCSPSERITRLIHQTFKTTEIPQRWRAAQQSCQDLHRENWTYILWTDSAAEKFLEENYPWSLPRYRRYPYAIQRVDMVRYFILYHFGGIYLDLDVGCKKELSPLLKYSALLPKTSPLGVSNDVMAGSMHHPFFGKVIHGLKTNVFDWSPKYLAVLFSTGPMFLTGQVLRFWRRQDEQNTNIISNDEENEKDIKTNTETNVDKSSGYSNPPPPPQTPCYRPNEEEVHIIPPHLYGSNTDSFFSHYPGSSWHGNDANAVKFLVGHRAWFVLLGMVGMVVGTGVVVVWVVRRRRWRSRGGEGKNGFGVGLGLGIGSHRL